MKETRVQDDAFATDLDKLLVKYGYSTFVFVGIDKTGRGASMSAFKSLEESLAAASLLTASVPEFMEINLMAMLSAYIRHIKDKVAQAEAEDEVNIDDFTVKGSFH